MALDVVVVNFHTEDLLKQFVDSYQEHSWPDCTLTIVDVEATMDYSNLGPWDHYLSIEQNCGYGRACNEGASHGSNDAILLANADTLLTDGLEVCYNALMHNPQWGVLGPRQVNEKGQITAGGIIGPDQAPRQRGWLEPDIDQYRFIDPSVRSVSGALYFIKRKVWEQLTDCPLFQEVQPGSKGAFLQTPHYYDETWCSYHARAHGYECVYYGVVKMYHYWHAASPHGGWADRQWDVSAGMYRAACARHGIVCE